MVSAAEEEETKGKLLMMPKDVDMEGIEDPDEIMKSTDMEKHYQYKEVRKSH
jgi:hypothetical protein